LAKREQGGWAHEAAKHGRLIARQLDEFVGSTWRSAPDRISLGSSTSGFRISHILGRKKRQRKPDGIGLDGLKQQCKG